MPLIALRTESFLLEWNVQCKKWSFLQIFFAAVLLFYEIIVNGSLQQLVMSEWAKNLFVFQLSNAHRSLIVYLMQKK